jgi:hypothetical protein
MNSKLHAKVLTMAAATLGLSLMGGCAKKSSDPAKAEGGEAASGAEASCGAGSCGAAGKGEHKGGGAEPALGQPDPAPESPANP